MLQSRHPCINPTHHSDNENCHWNDSPTHTRIIGKDELRKSKVQSAVQKSPLPESLVPRLCSPVRVQSRRRQTREKSEKILWIGILRIGGQLDGVRGQRKSAEDQKRTQQPNRVLSSSKPSSQCEVLRVLERAKGKRPRIPTALG